MFIIKSEQEAIMYNLFVVQTPFQLFNAVEAKNRFHLNQKNILIIIHKGNYKNLDQIMKILDYDSGWTEVIKIDFFTKIQKLFYPINAKSILNRLNTLKIDTIYVALYRNLAAHIVNSIKHNKTVLFDDGNSILKTINFLNQKKEKKYFFLRKVFAILLLRKSDIYFIYNIKIFTLFDLSSFKNITNEIIKNDFSYFKTKIKNLTKEEDVFLIGSRMIKNGISKETFESSLIYVVNYYRAINKRVYYVPHRYEDNEYLKILSEKYLFILSPFSSIVEFEFISKGIDPTEVATFRSTAVDTLNLIYNTNVKVFKIALDKIENDKKSEFELVYKNFENRRYATEDIK